MYFSGGRVEVRAFEVRDVRREDSDPVPLRGRPASGNGSGTNRFDPRDG
jgi:hypothetical protein